VWVDDQFHDAPDATADAKGAFAARGVSPGQHQLRARAAGVVTRGSQETVAPQDGVRLVLPRDGRVSLRLRLPDGAPRPATRRIHWNDYPNTADDDGPWTDGEIVTALPAGEYRLDIEVPGYVGVHRTNVAVSAGGRTDVGEIVLDPGLPLAGRVVDGAGNGVAFTAVFIDDEILRTDRDGRFRLEHAAAGPHEIRSSLSPDFLDEAMNVTLAADSAPVVVTLRRGAIVTVRLHGVPNEQRESYSVTASAAEAAEADELHWLQEAEEGSWVRLPAGSHRIEVRRDEVVVAVKTVALREGEDVTVEIDVAPK
jgi:hypothetical protein